MHVDITLVQGLMLGIFIMTNKFIVTHHMCVYHLYLCRCYFPFYRFFFRKNYPFYADMPAYLIIIMDVHSLVGYDWNFPMILIFKGKNSKLFSGSWNHWLSRELTQNLPLFLSSFFVLFCHSNDFRSASQSIISVQTAFCISFFYDERTFHVVEKLFYPTFLLIYYSSLCYWLLNYSSYRKNFNGIKTYTRRSRHIEIVNK